MNISKKIKLLFLDPVNFFKLIQNEKKYFPILIFSVLGFLILDVIDIALKLTKVNYGAIGLKAYFVILIYIFGLIFSILISFIIPFITAGISHLGVMLLKGSKGFLETFKAVTFGTIVFIPYWMASLIVLSFAPLTKSLYFNYLMLLNPYALFGITSFIIGLIHSTYVEVIGISQYHKISKLKALVAILVIPIIIILILVTIGILFLFFYKKKLVTTF